MSDKEKLEKYIRDTTPQKKVEKEPEPPPVPKKKAPETPTSWYYKRVWQQFFYISLFICFFIPLIFAHLNSEQGMDLETAITWGALITGSAMLINLLINSYRSWRYHRWIGSKVYKLVGWTEFFEKRKRDYWEKRNYTYLRVEFNLTPEATDLHRKAVKAFTAKVIAKWNKRYEDKDLDWEHGKPKDLNTNGLALYGDISQAELPIIVTILAARFIPLAKMLGQNLKHVLIRSDYSERELSMREEKDDGYYTQREPGFHND